MDMLFPFTSGFKKSAGDSASADLAIAGLPENTANRVLENIS